MHIGNMRASEASRGASGSSVIDIPPERMELEASPEWDRHWEERVQRLRLEAQRKTLDVRDVTGNDEIEMDAEETVGNGEYVFLSPKDVCGVVIDIHSGFGTVEIWWGGELLEEYHTGRRGRVNDPLIRDAGFMYYDVEEWESCRLVGRPTVWFLRNTGTPASEEREENGNGDQDEDVMELVDHCIELVNDWPELEMPHGSPEHERLGIARLKVVLTRFTGRPTSDEMARYIYWRLTAAEERPEIVEMIERESLAGN
ncbi:hypothetical protein QBC43DRAFT_306363 [Cladorrhinum sp. PSN259]|nr:hypothetical protein QBC43DRAFT_306363 [Cladorrhinum sp. PSN259]